MGAARSALPSQLAPSHFCILAQGADELQLNWGLIIDNKDYVYSNLRAITCIQVFARPPAHGDATSREPMPRGTGCVPLSD